MSLGSECSTTMQVAPVGYANGGNGNSMWGDNNAWWIILFLIYGWGNNGWGGNGNMNGAAGPVAQGYDTRADVQRGFDNQSVMNKLNGLESGICSLGYDQLAQMNGINANVAAGFAGVNSAVCQLGYQNADLIHGVNDTVNQGFNATNIALMQGQNAIASQLASNNYALSSQLANCCCETQQNIKDNTTQSVMNTNAIQQQIQQCCCDNEKIALQSRFDAQQYNCNTLQAIDKVGDRIIDYMANQQAQALRDENQALRLAASQAAQNQYLVNQLKPCPQPAYITCNPFTGQYGGFGGCACGA